MSTFIKALATPLSQKTGEHLPDMDINITLDDFKQYIKKTKENTSSSPSGLHYGHYIVCCEDDELAAVLLTIMLLPF